MTPISVRSKPIRQLRSLFRRFRNAVKAFRNNEIGYHLSIGRFGNFDVAYRQGTTDEEVISHSFEKDMFFTSITDYAPEPHHIILDVGAHIGTFSLLAASKVTKGMVYAVEANKESFNYLRINIVLNKCHNVTANHLALSDRKGETTLYYRDVNSGHSIMTKTSHGEQVPTDTLSDYFSMNGIEHCHFVKFNCEGAEFPILLSAPAEVLSHIDNMLILYHCDLAMGYNHKDLEKHLQNCGFKTKTLNQEDDRGWIVARQMK